MVTFKGQFGPALEPECSQSAGLPDRNALRAEVRRRLDAKRAEDAARQFSGPAPRYDAIYWAGVAWLDTL